MRTVTVEVPADVIVAFAEKLGNTDFENRISGITEQNEVKIEVFYEKHEHAAIDELEEYLEELIETIEEDED